MGDAALLDGTAIELWSMALESCLGILQRFDGGFGFFALFGVQVQDEGRVGAVLTVGGCVVGDGGAGRSTVACVGVLESERRHFCFG